ncbi:MAG: hypothetical protein ACLSE7_01890 [Lachnospirales bacterium]
MRSPLKKDPVLRILPWVAALAGAATAAVLWDRELLRRASYGLLLTFVFVGNLEQIPAASALLSRLIAGRELAVGILLSQVISNVPAAMLLSGFTRDYVPLLLGVNLGWLGTLIASMASLISYKLYAAADHARPLGPIWGPSPPSTRPCWRRSGPLRRLFPE